MEQFKQLENDPSLIKDFKTGAIVNTNKEAYKSAMVRKKKNKEIRDLKKQIKDLNNRVSILENHILSDINNN